MYESQLEPPQTQLAPAAKHRALHTHDNVIPAGKKGFSRTGTRTPVSRVRDGCANHLYHTGMEVTLYLKFTKMNQACRGAIDYTVQTSIEAGIWRYTFSKRVHSIQL